MAFLSITEALTITFIALLMFLYKVIQLLTNVSLPVTYTIERMQWGYQLSIDGPWAEEDTQDIPQLEADKLQTPVAQPAMVAAPFGLPQGPNGQAPIGFPETWNVPNQQYETTLTITRKGD